MKPLADFFRSEKGMETVEYAIILAFVSLGLIAAVVFLSETVTTRFNTAAEDVSG